MKYSEIIELVKRGKIGLLPNYQGYFKWDYGKNCMFMENGNYRKYDLDYESTRNDFYYII